MEPPGSLLVLVEAVYICYISLLFCLGMYHKENQNDIKVCNSGVFWGLRDFIPVYLVSNQFVFLTLSSIGIT